MTFWLGAILKDPEKRAIASWLGGGAMAVAGIIGTVVTFFDHKAPHEQGPSPELVAQIQKPLADEIAAQRARNDKLTELLLEKNPAAAAAPGARQAVGEAVGLIAQGAEEGDPRLRQALGLLKDNKTAEAAQLLNAVAKDKTAHAEQATAQAGKDRKEAAIAYRTLGAIAGLRDPKAAREAYAKAVALDPDNAKGLFWDGWFQLEAGNLAAAEKSYRALLLLAGKGADEHQLFWARNGLGDIAVARGDLNAALAAYGEARSAMERIAGSDPGNAGWQRDLSVSYDRVGDVLVAQGNLPEALKSFRDGLAIADRLAKADPGNAGWQRDLSVSYAKLASAHKQIGDKAKALEEFRQGQEIIARLTKLSPDNAVWREDLAWFEGQLKELGHSAGHGGPRIKSGDRARPSKHP